MQTQLKPQPLIERSPVVSSISILFSRKQYRCCHIRVPDMEERLPAIAANGRYYSFLKAIQGKQQALKIAANLQHRGEEIAVTQTPKGYVIWGWEPDADEIVRDRNRRLAKAPPSAAPSTPILDSPRQYRLCRIRVPDLEGPLSAIVFEDRYYSHFQVVQDLDQLQRVAAILRNRGDQMIATQTEKGYTIWVWEPGAMPF